jgi:transposase InsO family protein
MRGKAYGGVFRGLMMGLHEEGRSFVELSGEFSVPRDVLARWWSRYREEGIEGLVPRSRRPQHSPNRIAGRVEKEILALRRKGLGPARIALQVPACAKTVHRILLRHGLNRLRQARPRVVRRYEKSRPGELLHLDIKFLPALRNARYDYEFAAVDDYTREAVAWITTEQNSATATAFLERLLKELTYPVEAIMTDNAWAFTMQKTSHPGRLSRFEQALRSYGIAHRLLRPYAPECNGKVERFFRTVDDECLNIQKLFTFGARSKAVDRFLWYYNNQRPHLSLGGLTPVQRRQAFFAQAGMRPIS